MLASPSPHVSLGRPRTAVGLALLLGLAAASGCASSYRADPYREYSLRTYRYEPTPVTPPAPPRLRRSDVEVEARLQARALAVRADAARAAAQRATVSSAPPELAVAVSEAQAAYARGEVALAAAWVDAHPRLLEWSQAGSLAEIEASFVRAPAGYLEVSITRREGVSGPFALAFPPGSYAQDSYPQDLATHGAGGPAPAPSPEEELLRFLVQLEVGGGLADRGGDWTRPESERRWGHWPRAQDLALLEAPVVALAPHQHRAVVRIPVACAVFERAAPEPGHPYRLARYETGSTIEALLIQLCSRRNPAPGPAQLAVWLAREDLGWPAYVRQAGHRGRIANFQDGLPVLPRHADGAAELLLEAGVDPRSRRFYEVEGGGPRAEPAPSDEPDPTAPSETVAAPPLLTRPAG